MEHPTVNFSLTVKDGAAALDFYVKAFAAEELYRMTAPDGSIAHSEFKIGNTHIYLSGESPEWHAFAMPDGAMASCLFSILTDNCDQSFDRAVKAGAQPLSEPADQFWGTRSAIVKDPFGYRWAFGQMIEELSTEEIERRAQELFSS